MTKKESIKSILGDKNEIIRKLFFITFGNLLCSIAINLFFIPNGLLSGGVSGLGIMIHYLTSMPTGILVFLINLPIFIVGYRILDKKFLAYAFISSFILSFILTATEGIGQYLVIDDILLAAVFGAIFNGVGMGLMFRNGTCQAGFDVIAAILKKKYNINIGTGLMTVNTVVISLSSLLFGYKRAMYTLIALYISYTLLDKVQTGLNVQKKIIMVSDKSHELSIAIMKEMGRGVTFLKGEGGYTKDEKNIIYCILTSREIVQFKEVVEKIDPNAFLTINDVVEVKGSGFKSLEI